MRTRTHLRVVLSYRAAAAGTGRGLVEPRRLSIAVTRIGSSPFPLMTTWPRWRSGVRGPADSELTLAAFADGQSAGWACSWRLAVPIGDAAVVCLSGNARSRPGAEPGSYEGLVRDARCAVCAGRRLRRRGRAVCAQFVSKARGLRRGAASALLQGR